MHLQVKNLDTYALIVADMVSVTENGGEIMTKHAKRPSDISYTVNDESEASSGSDEDGDEEDDAALAKKISKQEDNVMQGQRQSCLLYTSPSPRDVEESRMPSSA